MPETKGYSRGVIFWSLLLSQRLRVTSASDPRGTPGVLSLRPDFGFRHKFQNECLALHAPNSSPTAVLLSARYRVTRASSSYPVLKTEVSPRSSPYVCCVHDITPVFPAFSLRFIAAWPNNLSLSYRLCHQSMKERQRHFLWLSSMLTGGSSVYREGHTHRTRWFTG